MLQRGIDSNQNRSRLIARIAHRALPEISLGIGSPTGFFFFEPAFLSRKRGGPPKSVNNLQKLSLPNLDSVQISQFSRCLNFLEHHERCNFMGSNGLQVWHEPCASSGAVAKVLRGAENGLSIGSVSWYVVRTWPRWVGPKAYVLPVRNRE